MTEHNMGALISAAVAARVTPEYVEEQVTKRVDKLIDEAVNDALRTYSENGKLISEAVKEALKVDRVDLPSYGHVVTKILKAQIEAIVSDLVAGRLSEDMAELLSLAPKTVKLSEIAETMLENHDDGYGPVITVIVERNDYGSAWVYLDEDNVIEDRDKYRAAVRLLINGDGIISSATMNGGEYADVRGKTVVNQIGRAYGLEQRVRAFVACGTVIELDEDDVITSKGDY